MRLSSVNLTFFILLLLLFLLPFVWIPNIFNPFELPKFIFFLAGVVVCSLIYLKKTLVSGCFYTVKLPTDPLSFCIVGYAIVVFVANIFGVDPQTSFFGSMFRYQGFLLLLGLVFLYFIVFTTFIKQQKNKWPVHTFINYVIFVSAFLLSVVAITQAVSFYIFHDTTVLMYQQRVIGTFGNPNFLGGYLLMLLPFLLFTGNYKHLPQLVQFFLRIVLSLIVIVTIILSSSRGVLLGLGVLLVIYFIWLFRKLGNIKKSILFILVGIILAVTFSSSTAAFLQRNSMWDNRAVIWQGGYEAFLKRPLLGYGQENFELAFTKVKFWKVDNAHNIFLEVLTSSGIIGFVFFALILFFAFLKADFIMRLVLCMFLICAQFNPLSIAQLVFFWFLLGLISAFKKR